MENNTMASIISERRKALNLTQQALADKLHITNKAISKWETGEGLPDISILKELSIALEISVDELLGNPKTQIPSVSKVNSKRVFTLIVRSALLLIFLLPFISISWVLGPGANFSTTTTGYTLMQASSLEFVYLKFFFIIQILLLVTDLAHLPNSPFVSKLTATAHFISIGAAVVIPIRCLILGYSIEMGMILFVVFTLSLSLQSLKCFNSKQKTA